MRCASPAAGSLGGHADERVAAEQHGAVHEEVADAEQQRLLRVVAERGPQEQREQRAQQVLRPHLRQTQYSAFCRAKLTNSSRARLCVKRRGKKEKKTVGRDRRFEASVLNALGLARRSSALSRASVSALALAVRGRAVRSA